MIHRWIQKIPPKWRLPIGWTLVIVGAILGPVPVIQGWIFGLPGLIILADHYHWARRILSWARRKPEVQEVEHEQKKETAKP